MPAVCLILLILSKASYPSSSFTYCLRRLVRGLSSDRSSARNGFYSALVTLLGQLPSDVSAETIVGEIKGFMQDNVAKSTKSEVMLFELLQEKEPNLHSEIPYSNCRRENFFAARCFAVERSCDGAGWSRSRRQRPSPTS